MGLFMPKTTFEPGVTFAGGRLTQHLKPKPGMTYALGCDTALGIEGKDFDAIELFDSDGKQAFEAVGHWDLRTAGVIREIVSHYGGVRAVFIVIERATVGLPIARELHEAGFWVYFERDEEVRARPVRDRLGHAPKHNDATIRELQKRIAPYDDLGVLQRPTIEIYSAELHDQLCKFGYRHKAESKTFEDARDRDLVMGSPKGEHDDLVRAAALSVAGLLWLPQYQPPKPRFAAGTYGELVGMNEPEKPKDSSYF